MTLIGRMSDSATAIVILSPNEDASIVFESRPVGSADSKFVPVTVLRLHTARTCDELQPTRVKRNTYDLHSDPQRTQYQCEGPNAKFTSGSENFFVGLSTSSSSEGGVFTVSSSSLDMSSKRLMTAKETGIEKKHVIQTAALIETLWMSPTSSHR